MKKNIAFILGILCIYGLSACGRTKNNNSSSGLTSSVVPSSVHTHTYSDTWSCDGTYHWHAATCGHDEVSNKAEHTFGEWVVDNAATVDAKGSMHRTCTVCDFEQVEEVDKLLPTLDKINLKLSDNGAYFIVSSAISKNIRGEVIIPSTYGSLPVSSIDDYAFEDCSFLTSITIPDSITSIKRYAFSGCSSLTSITIPNSVTTIGEYSFYDCSSLTSITIPDSITSIKRYAFSGCSSLTSITIPNSVTTIGEYSFYDCSSLTSITISNSVTSIEYGAFSGCSSLTSVTIPNSVTEIGGWIFSNCSSLVQINVISTNKHYSSVEGVLYDKDKKVLICYPIGKQDTFFTIPNSVTSIDSCAFDCSSLTSITIPNSVTTIGYHAFRGCSSLTSITIPNSVILIDNGAFYNCSSLTSITIPNSVISIGEYTFYGCSSLESVAIGSGVSSIGDRAFLSCSSLTHINVISTNEYYSSVEGVLYNKGRTVLIYYPLGKETSFTIPYGVTSIGYEAFRSCSSLTSIIIPNSVTSIQHEAFFGCSSLESVTIADSVTSIGYYAFLGCPSLTSITFEGTMDQWNAISKGTYWKSDALNMVY